MGEPLAAELPVSRWSSFKKVQRIFLSSDDAVCCVCWSSSLLSQVDSFLFLFKFGQMQFDWYVREVHFHEKRVIAAD